jgi:Rrf2 family transcriptional regulator, iron-sulfur cluster assembly transcription factor
MSFLFEKDVLLIAAVVYIASHGDNSSVLARDAAACLHLSARFLEPQFQSLVRGDVLVSKRGPAGGYALARMANLISVGDMLRAAQLERPAVRKTVLSRLAARLDGLFDNLTIADLLK